MVQFVSAQEAVSRLKDGMTVGIGGFGAYGPSDELLSALEAAGELDQVSSIDLTHSTWVGMRYRENFDARLPLGEDMAHSLAVLSAAVEDTLQTRGPQAAGTMDLTQEMADAIFTPAES